MHLRADHMTGLDSYNGLKGSPRAAALGLVLALAGLAGGCATLTEPRRQQLELHTILDYREVAGVGCVLANEAGRWFVVAPGRVTIARSAGPLSVQCAHGEGSAHTLVASRFDTGKLIGNAVVSGGLGYLVDRHSGAGFDYPATLTVILQRTPARDAPEVAAAHHNVMY
jgi:hypothetical protein